MNQLNCCKEFNIEYESRAQDTSGKLCYPKPARFICRIREFLSFIKRTRGSGARRVREWMKGNSTYTKHRYARRRFPTNKVFVNGIDDTWQMDLVDMCSYNRTNNGYNWILVCIDVFSKFVWIKVLKTKAANPVAVAFREIISDGRKPINLQYDEGTEFINTTFKRLCREQNINLYHVESDK